MLHKATMQDKAFFILNIDDYIKCTRRRTSKGVFSTSTFFPSQSVVVGCRNRKGETWLVVVTDMLSPGELEQNQVE